MTFGIDIILALTDERTIYHHAAFNPWLMALIFAAALLLILYLYRAQQRIASRRAIIGLTTLRVLLLACVAAMLLQPAVRWARHHSSAGTLFVLLDATGSMAATDP